MASTAEGYELSFGLLNEKSKVKSGPPVTTSNLFR